MATIWSIPLPNLTISQETGVLGSVTLAINCVSLDKSNNLSGTQLPYLLDERII